MSITISVIVPTFNRASLLRESLAAIHAQTYPIDEILVIDDGSSDETPEVVAAAEGPVRCISQRNAGKAAALNRALGEIRGDCVWICDDDDLVLPEAAASLVAALEREDADFAFGTYARFERDPASGKVTKRNRGYWPDLQGRSIFIALLEDFFMFQNATLVRRSMYDTVGPFRADLTRSQDYEMALRIARAGKGAFVPEVVFLQREHDGDRGSARERFGAQEQVQKWSLFDQKIFKELYLRLPLAEFGRELPTASGDLLRRGALLQRACVYARRGLWDVSRQDLRNAALTCASEPLTEQERGICGRVFASKYGCDWITQTPLVRQDLADLANLGVAGREIALNMARPLLWRAREALVGGRPGRSTAFLGLLGKTHGLRGVAGLALAAVRKQAGIFPNSQQQIKS